MSIVTTGLLWHFILFALQLHDTCVYPFEFIYFGKLTPSLGSVTLPGKGKKARTAISNFRACAVLVIVSPFLHQLSAQDPSTLGTIAASRNSLQVLDLQFIGAKLHSQPPQFTLHAFATTHLVAVLLTKLEQQYPIVATMDNAGMDYENPEGDRYEGMSASLCSLLMQF